MNCQALYGIFRAYMMYDFVQASLRVSTSSYLVAAGTQKISIGSFYMPPARCRFLGRSVVGPAIPDSNCLIPCFVNHPRSIFEISVYPLPIIPIRMNPK